MTKAQRDALKWFREHGGDGVRQGRGRVQIRASGEIAPFMWITFRTLIELGLIEQYNSWRLRLTPSPTKHEETV